MASTDDNPIVDATMFTKCWVVLDPHAVSNYQEKTIAVPKRSPKSNASFQSRHQTLSKDTKLKKFAKASSSVSCSESEGKAIQKKPRENGKYARLPVAKISESSSKKSMEQEEASKPTPTKKSVINRAPPPKSSSSKDGKLAPDETLVEAVKRPPPNTRHQRPAKKAKKELSNDNKTPAASPEEDDEAESDRPDILLGTSDFKLLRFCKYFVDKSQMIKEFWTDDLVYIITVPRRWGKSTILSALKYFFQIQVNDKTGRKVTKEDLTSDKIITDTSNYKLFKKLQIAKNRPMMEKFGKYPVISVNFQTSEKVLSVKSAVAIVKYAIHKCYKQHSYLMKSRRLDDQAKSVIGGWCGDKLFALKTEAEINISLQQLSEYLHKHWGRKCIILVDEYDAIPMHALRCKSVLPETIEAINSVISEVLLHVGKDNDNHLERMLVTGISYVKGIWSTWNNYIPYHFLEGHKFEQYYGLLESEVETLLKKSAITEYSYKDVSLHYNGYTTLGGQSIYSIWSVMHFLKFKKLGDYWYKSGIILGLYESFKAQKMRAKINRLINNEAIEVRVQRDLTTYEIEKIQKFLNKPDDDNVHDLIFSFFFDQGALSVVSRSVCQKIWKLKIPNAEVKNNIQTALFTYYGEYLSEFSGERETAAGAFDAIFESIALPNNKMRSSVAKYLAALRKFALKAFPRFDTITHQELVCLVHSAAVESSCESCRAELKIEDGGRVDFCAMYPGKLVNPRKIAIIVEVKINESIERGQKQVIDRNYISALNDKDFKSAEQAIIMVLRLVRPESSSPSKLRKLKLETAYTTYRPRQNKKITLDKTNWIYENYPEK